MFSKYDIDNTVKIINITIRYSNLIYISQAYFSTYYLNLNWYLFILFSTKYLSIVLSFNIDTKKAIYAIDNIKMIDLVIIDILLYFSTFFIEYTPIRFLFYFKVVYCLYHNYKYSQLIN